MMVCHSRCGEAEMGGAVICSVDGEYSKGILLGDVFLNAWHLLDIGRAALTDISRA
ncbi:hypothetical protein PBR20603_02099 [Pandoraea bronchicola]|uniref:Uncharacterized protein n=1 Tax=Pandoraea bronchicola TaxID=2508287 RepID=A0A5E5BV13_9BURK|nr:hypothetical protein PBR20603_02099 [Pandoraea bronchicola]